jgi:hypothetical protein
MASQCECDKGDPFTETQEGRDVLGFYVGDDKYRQDNFTLYFTPASVSAWNGYGYMNKIKVGDATQVGYYYFFRLSAQVHSINKVTSSPITIGALHFQVVSKEPLKERQKYYFSAVSPEELFLDGKTLARISCKYRDDLLPSLPPGSEYAWNWVSVNSGYIEFTKYAPSDNPFESISSGHFELQIDIEQKDGSIEQVKITGGVFDALLE